MLVTHTNARTREHKGLKKVSYIVRICILNLYCTLGLSTVISLSSSMSFLMAHGYCSSVPNQICLRDVREWDKTVSNTTPWWNYGLKTNFRVLQSYLVSIYSHVLVRECSSVAYLKAPTLHGWTLEQLGHRVARLLYTWHRPTAPWMWHGLFMYKVRS